MAGEFAIRPFRFAFRCFHPMNLTIACQPRREQVSGYTGAITFSGTPLLDLVSCIVWSALNSSLVNLRDALSCLRKQLIRSRQDRCVAYSGRLFSRRLAFSSRKCLIADARLLRRYRRGARCLRHFEKSNGSIRADKLDIVRPRRASAYCEAITSTSGILALQSAPNQPNSARRDSLPAKRLRWTCISPPGEAVILLFGPPTAGPDAANTTNDAASAAMNPV